VLKLRLEIGHVVEGVPQTEFDARNSETDFLDGESFLSVTLVDFNAVVFRHEKQGARGKAVFASGEFRYTPGRACIRMSQGPV